MTASTAGGGSTLVLLLIYSIFGFITLPFFGLSIYCLVLFIKVARRGIKALDIYIQKNSD